MLAYESIFAYDSDYSSDNYSSDDEPQSQAPANGGNAKAKKSERLTQLISMILDSDEEHDLERESKTDYGSCTDLEGSKEQKAQGEQNTKTNTEEERGTDGNENKFDLTNLLKSSTFKLAACAGVLMLVLVGWCCASSWGNSNTNAASENNNNNVNKQLGGAGPGAQPVTKESSNEEINKTNSSGAYVPVVGKAAAGPAVANTADPGAAAPGANQVPEGQVPGPDGAVPAPESEQTPGRFRRVFSPRAGWMLCVFVLFLLLLAVSLNLGNVFKLGVIRNYHIGRVGAYYRNNTIGAAWIFVVFLVLFFFAIFMTCGGLSLAGKSGKFLGKKPVRTENESANMTTEAASGEGVPVNQNSPIDPNDSEPTNLATAILQHKMSRPVSLAGWVLLGLLCVGFIIVGGHLVGGELWVLEPLGANSQALTHEITATAVLGFVVLVMFGGLLLVAVAGALLA